MVNTYPKALVAGNWKMNGLKASISELESLITAVKEGAGAKCDVLICPPYTSVATFADKAAGSGVMIGAQDCHANKAGAHTGDISAEMLKDAGAVHIIVGHSERRADHGEDDKTVHDKAVAVWGEGLTAIICVGETESQRDAGKAVDVVASQLAGSVPDGATAENTVIAYEPVWAIGTGRTPTTEDVAEMHTAMRTILTERFGEGAAAMKLLYGGSVKAANAVELMGAAHVNGALVGGASLKATDFDGIIDAYR